MQKNYVLYKIKFKRRAEHVLYFSMFDNYFLTAYLNFTNKILFCSKLRMTF